MKSSSSLWRLLLSLFLALSASCATGGSPPERPARLRVTPLSGDRLQLDFEPLPPDFALERFSEAEALAVLAASYEAFPEASEVQVLPAQARSRAPAAAWERRLLEEFIARYGQGRLPVPDSIQHSPLYRALKLSPRYMGEGIRDAARDG